MAVSIALVAFLCLLANFALGAPANVTERDLAVRAKVKGGQIFYGCKKRNAIALTFNNGPFEYHDEILKNLAKYRARATFFVNGDNYECIYTPKNVERLQNAIKAGHQIANNGWNSWDLTALAPEDAKIQITRLDEALLKIIGVKPAFIQPPYNNYDTAVYNLIKENQQDIVFWDYSIGDLDGLSTEESKEKYKQLAYRHPRNAIVFNHETVHE
ncbi:Carbohydrate esterase 4 protein [Tulasnella sp. 403]|nr:Carbohydrate esterase 4 protein [Tulasnella sp. 403]